MKLRLSIIFATSTLFFATTVTTVFAADPLPSWQEGKNKSAIVHFVEEVTKENGPSFVPAAERIATFDNDGTLWVEQPMYVQLRFALDRAKALMPAFPKQKRSEPLRLAIAGDCSALVAGGERALSQRFDPRYNYCRQRERSGWRQKL